MSQSENFLLTLEIGLGFTPHPIKPRYSPASLREAGRAEQKYMGELNI